MDIVTYAAYNGITVEEAKEALARPAQEESRIVNPMSCVPKLRADERRYGGRTAWNTGPLQQ